MYLCVHMGDLPDVNGATAQCLLEFEILMIFVCMQIRVNASWGDKCATKWSSTRLGCTYANATGRILARP